MKTLQNMLGRHIVVMLAAVAGAATFAPTAQAGCPPPGLGFIQLPASGPGFHTVNAATGRWGTPELVYGLQDTARDWAPAQVSGGVARIGIGDLSMQNGGAFAPHASHRCGIDVDVWPLASYPYEGTLTWQSPQYSRDATNWNIQMVLPTHVREDVVFFNDPALIGQGKIQQWPSHDNHFHLRIQRPPSVATCQNS